MIVPEFWSEAKRQISHHDRQTTIRRFGWSDESEAAAQEHARGRLDDAIEHIQAGEQMLLREPKVPYNGADGLPIREEIIARHGDAVVTRNAYGALCLNTPDVLFADVDVTIKGGCAPYFYSLFLYAAGYFVLARMFVEARSIWLFLLGAIFFVIIAGSIWHWVADRLAGNPKDIARRRIERFAKRSPDWSLRLYETPLGWRVLVTHATFDPRSEEVRSFFEKIEVDPIYERMCFNQNCFRARVSPKPWRVGIPDHLRPRPGVWPVSDAGMAVRTRWVRHYEQKSKGFAACRFDSNLGGTSECPAAASIVRLHDELAFAQSDYPIA
ncbi:hypothetical protein [Allorhodopirellula solitaria]|uniref:Transmembrane protein n=1 Tax=Allorhodopirellula solitaria TaxID=2527987 RepID=A0A5C5XV06_9BACT|nr:hypothetical protein [Allorhodopirellula solitaria]TWT66401.1 hypothetical protein CA85_24950 [Allorhodopirellula solitaria]